jgi:hypothetical protein
MLSIDGVVGRNTWDMLAWHMVWNSYSGGYDYHKTYAGLPGAYWRKNMSTHRWGIPNYNNAYWTSFTAWGPS